MHKQKTKAFTLVELIVVIIILAILGTIAFISLQGYSTSARDSTRISDLSSMKSTLELFQLDAGKYPLPSDVTEITYSGAVAWSQGTFGETVFANIDKLDKIPTDPLTDKEYVYSTTGNRNEYQLVGAFEGDTVSLNTIGNEAIAAEKTAKAKITGSYNGKLLKVLSGSTTHVLAIPSIITSSGTTIDAILANSYLVYNGYKNLPFQYAGSYNVNGETGLNLVNASDILVYTGDIKTLSESTSTGTLARKTMLEKLQNAYSGTTIKNIGEISQILNTNTNDSTQTEYITTYLVKNDLGGSVKVTSPSTTNNNTTTYTNCTATTQSGYTIPQINHGISNQTVTKTITHGTSDLQISCNNGTLSYGTETINCDNNYIVSGNSCIADTCTGTMPDNTELNGTQGTATWTYSTTSGVCKYQCQTGYHTEDAGLTCTSNTRSCVITHGTGQETWNGSSWGTCTLVSCDNPYIQSGNTCVTQTQNDCTDAGWYWVSGNDDVYIGTSRGNGFCISPNITSKVWITRGSYYGGYDVASASYTDVRDSGNSWPQYGATRKLDLPTPYTCKALGTSLTDFDTTDGNGDTLKNRMKWLALNATDAAKTNYVEWASTSNNKSAVILADCLDGVKDLTTDMTYTHNNGTTESITYASYNVNITSNTDTALLTNVTYQARQKYLTAWTQKSGSHLPSAFSYFTNGTPGGCENTSCNNLTLSARGEYQVVCELGLPNATTNTRLAALGTIDGSGFGRHSRSMTTTNCGTQSQECTPLDGTAAGQVTVSAVEGLRIVYRP